MKLIIAGIWDAALGSYTAPAFYQSRGLAIRQFTDLVEDGDSLPSKHPSDFSLFGLGELDTETGRITTPTAPEPLISGQSLTTGADHGAAQKSGNGEPAWEPPGQLPVQSGTDSQHSALGVQPKPRRQDRIR